jgi:hypothetical protein
VQYEWVLVHDEDVHFVRGELRIEDWLASLATVERKGFVDKPLTELGKSRVANEFHRATAEPCLVLAKDVNPFPGINAGTLYVKNTLKAKELLRRMWMWPLENPAMRVYMSEKWAFEQDVLNLGILTDPDFDDCVHVVPTAELYSTPEADPRQVGDFMFHNTGGLCGRPHLSPRPGMVAAKKSDCLDELYGVQLKHALTKAPDPTETACNARDVSVNPSNVPGDKETFGLRLTQHCLTPKHAAAQLPPIFLADPKTQEFPVANISNRVAKPQCLTFTCYARNERDKAREHYTMLMQAKHAGLRAAESAKRTDPPPMLFSGSGNPPRAHQQVQLSPPHGSKEAKRAAEHTAVMKGPVLPENVLRFEDLPSTDSHGKPLARHAFVTLITQGGCDQDSFGYTAGAFALIESLQRTGTKLRIVVAMTNAVEKSAELAAQFMAVGAEPVMLEIIDHHGSGLNRLVSARHRHRQHALAEGGGSATAAEYGGHRRLLERWKGMFSKLLLWAPWGALDKIVYLDTDHVVLHNIDHVVTMCAHSGICAVNDPTQNRMWDGNYVNAGMMVREHAGRTMVRAHRDIATTSPMIMHLGRVSAVAE